MPTWSSCASTRCAIPARPAALAGRRKPGHRHLPPQVGRRVVRGIRGRTPRDPERGAVARRRVRRPRVAGQLRRPVQNDRRAPASCCRITISTACPPICPSWRRPCWRPAPRSSRSPSWPTGSPTASRCARSASRRASPIVLIAMGDAGMPTPRAGRAVRIVLDLCRRRRRRPGRSARSGMRERVRLPPDRTAAPRSTACVGRPVGHSVSPAMHNAAFRAARRRRRVSAARRGRLRRLPGVCRSGQPRGRQRHRAVQGATAFERADDAIRSAGASSRSTRCGASGTKWLGMQHRRRGLPGAARSRRCDLQGLRATVLGAGGAARSVAVALAVGRRARDASRRAATTRRATVAALTGATVGTWPPAPGSWDLLVNATPVGTAPDVDESPLPDGYPLDGMLVYDLVYNPPRHAPADATPRDAGCQTHRRPRHAGRAGAGAVRVVDRRSGPPDRVMRDAAPLGCGIKRDAMHAHETDDVRRVRGPGPARRRSCPCARRSWRTC